VEDKYFSCVEACVAFFESLKENSGAKWTFGLIKHWHLVNRSLSFFFLW